MVGVEEEVHLLDKGEAVAMPIREAQLAQVVGGKVGGLHKTGGGQVGKIIGEYEELVTARGIGVWVGQFMKGQGVGKGWRAWAKGAATRW